MADEMDAGTDEAAGMAGEAQVEESEDQQAPQAPVQEEEVDAELEQKLPFPTAAVVRIMKRQMDGDKMIKKEVKVAMNKWLGDLCEAVAKEMNKNPYVMMHLHEFQKAKEQYDNLQTFKEEKDRVLAHFEAIKKDIERLEKDLGKLQISEEIK